MNHIFVKINIKDFISIFQVVNIDWKKKRKKKKLSVDINETCTRKIVKAVKKLVNLSMNPFDTPLRQLIAESR